MVPGLARPVAVEPHRAGGSKIERGEVKLSRSELGTLESYVAAIGGMLHVVADFGDHIVTVE